MVDVGESDNDDETGGIDEQEEESRIMEFANESSVNFRENAICGSATAGRLMR